MYKQLKKIAILSPVAWRTPPKQYGAWETVASNITEGLVERGWDVTLFATGNSLTKAKLHSIIPLSYEENKEIDPKVAEYLHISEFFEHADEFDLLHCHYDFMALTYSKLVSTPVLTTIHGFSSPKILPIYYKYKNVHYVSISDSDRDNGINYLGTVYNGIDLSLHEYFESGDDLVFLGRIHPDKGVHLAIETALKTKRNLIIAGIIQDEKYFNDKVKPHIDGKKIKFIGAVGPIEKNKLFSNAYALLHLNQLNERFGLVLAEANASGVPVIAMDRGSCREVIKDNETGFLVNSVEEAVKALDQVKSISRKQCRDHIVQNFSLEKMVFAYEKIYEKIFKIEDKKHNKG